MKLKKNLLTFLFFSPHKEIDKMKRKVEVHEQAILAPARSWDLRMGIFILLHTLAHSNQNRLL